MTSNVKGWPNIPAHIETFVHPHAPSFTQDVKRVYAICRGNEQAIRNFLDHTSFEYVSDLFLIEFADYSNRTYPASPGETWGFMDCSIYVQTKYKGRAGGYILFEYEDQDYSIFAGREMWGYPKTYGEVSLKEEADRITGTVVKAGREIVRMECDLNSPLESLAEITVSPVFNLYTIPKAEGPGIFSQRIISRDTSPGFHVKSQKYFKASLVFDSIRQHPLKDLGPIEVLGAALQTADYDMNEKCGWAKVEETII